MRHLSHLILTISAIFLAFPLMGDEPLPSATPQPPAPRPVAVSTAQSQTTALLEQARLNQEENHKRNLELIEKVEGLYKRQEGDLVRFEKILDTWERQQAQYQKYLDILPTSK